MSFNVSNEQIALRIMQNKQWMTETPEGKEWAEGCKEGLAMKDYNGDGQTSAIEMYKDISDTYSFIFEGNDEFSARAQEIALAQGEIYSKYAGDDGILDEYEYNAALQSDENGALLDQYWEMKDAWEAMQGNNEIKGLFRNDINNDKQVGAIEIYQNKVDLYSEVFKDDSEKLEMAKQIALTQAEILSKYAGDDGVLSSEEYANALRSESYGLTMEAYLNLVSSLNSLKA